jgi:hypothetical protein
MDIGSCRKTIKLMPNISISLLEQNSDKRMASWWFSGDLIFGNLFFEHHVRTLTCTPAQDLGPRSNTQTISICVFLDSIKKFVFSKL